jgi:hypothetical protein
VVAGKPKKSLAALDRDPDPAIQIVAVDASGKLIEPNRLIQHVVF